LSAPVSSPAPPSSLSASWARSAMRRAVAPRAPSLSLCVVGLPCQLRPPHARRGPASAHSRTSSGSSATSLCPHPSSFLSLAHARTHSPASFHAVSPSLVLCSRRQTSPETHARLPGHLAHRRPRQATPSSTLRWGTCARAQFSQFRFVVGQFWLRRSSAVVVRRARAVTDQISPV
jgi:hypothetical protein